MPALVMARGHRIEGVNEIPFVLDDTFAKLDKTSKVGLGCGSGVGCGSVSRG